MVSRGSRYNDIYTGWSYPPKDYAKWGELVYQWVHHCVERYGADEVNKWYWEVWNEPNIAYWHGSPEDFMKLHDYAIDGVRRALPTARVGGPDCAGPGVNGDTWTHVGFPTSIVCAEPITPPARPARRLISSHFTPKASRRSSTATSAWAS